METAEHIYCIADGRMQFEHFRGRSRNIMIRTSDGKIEPFAWFDASRLPDDEDPFRAVREQVSPGQQEYRFDPERFQAVLRQRFPDPRNLHMTMLLNSWGGVMGSAMMLNAISHMVREGGGSVSAFTGTIVGSAAADSMLEADDLSVLQDTYCMWHIATPQQARQAEMDIQFAPEEKQQRLASLLDRSHKIHEENGRILIHRAIPEHRETVRARVHDALERHGVRHEFSFSGVELHQFGIAQHGYAYVTELRDAFSQRHQIPVDHEDWVHDPFSRFFRLAAFEEDVRRALGHNLKMLMVTDHLYAWQVPQTVPSEHAPDMALQADAIVAPSLPPGVMHYKKVKPA